MSQDDTCDTGRVGVIARAGEIPSQILQITNIDTRWLLGALIRVRVMSVLCG